MSILHFTDGVSIDTAGPLRSLHLADGWYVVGQGMCVPVKDADEAARMIASDRAHRLAAVINSETEEP